MADFETDLAKFMGGIRRRETGSYAGNYAIKNSIGASGAYQFMPGTWRSWAGPELVKRYPEAYLAPKEIQDAVARRNMTALYHQFGNWSDVAKAWLGGPGSVHKVVSDGHVTNVQYAQQVLAYAGLASGDDLTNLGGGALPEMSTQASPSTPATVEEDDRHDLGVQLRDVLSFLDRSSDEAGQGEVSADTTPPEDPASEVLDRMAR